MEHSQSIDLEAYFGRIGYSGEGTATLETLRAIHTCHAQTIPFENLNPWLGEPVRLDPSSLEQKLVHEGRGGYCFEQNGLFGAALRALGFQVTNLAARVLWNMPPGMQTPRTHMLLRIDIDGQPYVADVGFGGSTLTGPLALVPDIEQTTPHEPFRLLHADGAYTMQALIGAEWRTLYRFDLQEQLAPDYEVANWYVSTNPNSHFVTTLVAARPDVGRRYALRNNQLAIHHLGGPSEGRTLTSAAELRTVLEDLLRLQLPAHPSLEAALERVAAL